MTQSKREHLEMNHAAWEACHRGWFEASTNKPRYYAQYRNSEDGRTWTVNRIYGDRTPEYSRCDESSGPYQYGNQDLVAVEFPHTLADILNAVFSSGLIVERMLERTDEKIRGSGRGTLPSDFFVSARKPEWACPRECHL